MRSYLTTCLAGLALGLLCPTVASAADSSSTDIEALAKQAQNPIASLISLPFQDNTNFNLGPYDRTQNVLNIQPVLPFQLNDHWNLITRTIVPIISQPKIESPTGRIDGIGDVNPTFFFSPKDKRTTTWGIGPSFFLPTASNRILGSGKLSVGPGLVVVSTPGHWVLGTLVNNVWSVAGQRDRQRVSQMTLQPFINYNIHDGWYTTTSPIITSDWAASPGNRWTVPMGGGFGRLFTLGGLYINAETQVFYDVMTPHDDGPRWGTRLQVKLLFPK